jgi:Domain of unknown function (DUF4188)
MAKVVAGRMSADTEGDFVVFLIGMRSNRPWHVIKSMYAFAAMPRMLAYLRKHPEAGLLHAMLVIGPDGPMVIQYWRTEAVRRHLARVVPGQSRAVRVPLRQHAALRARACGRARADRAQGQHCRRAARRDRLGAATAAAAAATRRGCRAGCAAADRDRGEELDRVGVALGAGGRRIRLGHGTGLLEGGAASAAAVLVSGHGLSLWAETALHHGVSRTE